MLIFKVAWAANAQRMKRTEFRFSLNISILNMASN